MTRLLAAVAALGLVACGTGSTRLELSLASDDALPAALTAQAAAAAKANDLTSVKAIRVTVLEVSVHVAGAGTPDPATPPTADTGPGWVVLSTTPTDYDLVALKTDFTAPLASGTVPEGKITQIRLKLGTTAPETGEGADAVAAAGGPPHDVIVGAVTELDDTVCDLIVPHSAFDPGIKIVHPWKALPLPENGVASAVVNLRVKESAREATASGCAYRLNPVIQVTAR